MNYVKTIKQNIMQEAAGKGLITGGIISLLVSLFLMFLRLNPGFIVPMADTLGICAVSVLVFWIFSLRRSGALSKRVASLERISGPIDNDVIRSVSKDTAFGNTWLAVGNKNRYRFWTKDMLEEISLVSNNPKAKQAVLQLKNRSGNIDKAIVYKSDALTQKVAEWMAPAAEITENVNDLTLGQM